MSWLSNIFNPKKQEAPALKQTPKLSEIAEYPLYKKTLEDRMAGIGIGYDPSVLSSATAPYAQARREQLSRYELPSINASASARGLGRSTIPVNIGAQKSQEASRDIEQRIAELTVQNEAQKASEKQNAISGYGNLMGTDYNAAVNNIASQNAQAEAAANAQNTNTNAYNQYSMKLLNSLVGAGTSLLGVPSSPLSLATVASTSSNALSNISASDLQDYWTNRNKATVKKA